ncbi:MAG: Txe/YoeB family addiction module toxin [Ruminococcaceae bacterium]|nr:Txe/YoeB family addiction module toxin [Oscillospiraceae bacterium]
MNIIWHDKAWEEYIDWQTTDKKLLKRINQLITDIQRNGNAVGVGNPEPLKGILSGYYSRHIDGGNRLIYRVNDNNIPEIVSCAGHYN